MLVVGVGLGATVGLALVDKVGCVEGVVVGPELGTGLIVGTGVGDSLGAVVGTILIKPSPSSLISLSPPAEKALTDSKVSPRYLTFCKVGILFLSKTAFSSMAFFNAC